MYAASYVWAKVLSYMEQQLSEVMVSAWFDDAEKESTQEEFFHTFNELYENGKQIVLTADRKPTDMATLEDRLRSRFGVGIMVAIKPPDLETRVMITQAKSKQMCLAFNADVIRYIAASL